MIEMFVGGVIALASVTVGLVFGTFFGSFLLIGEKGLGRQ
jgi:hypothetical protein